MKRFAIQDLAADSFRGAAIEKMYLFLHSVLALYKCKRPYAAFVISG